MIDRIDWTKFRMLKAGEIIEEGDWVECSYGWHAKPCWKPDTINVGKPAPDPQCPAHRLYARPLKGTTND